MPLINIKVIKDELTAGQSSDLIRRVTDAVVAVTSESLRAATWVVIDEVQSGHWGIGGDSIGLADVKAMLASPPSDEGGA